MESHTHSEITHQITPKRVYSINSASIHKTPPSYLGAKLKNPFEAVLREKLHTHLLSPSVFAKKTFTTSSCSEEKLKWSIDDLSLLKPADIDENSLAQYESIEFDSPSESIAQSRIDKFFSMHEIVPSPMQQPCNSEPLIYNMQSPESLPAIEVQDTYSQTELSLPPILPKHVEDVLKPYFTFTQYQHIGNDKKLFENLFDRHNNDDNEISNSDCLSSPLRLVEYSRIRSPDVNVLRSPNVRTIGTPGNFEILSDCDISPLCEEQFSQNGRGLSQMSVDGSFTVPNTSTENTENQNISIDFSVSNDECSYSTPSESFNKSQWELEYLSMPSSPVSSNANKDGSKLKLMRSRSFQLQRKKLSDSFDTFTDMEEEASQKTGKNETDVGYQTGTSCDSTTTKDGNEESWVTNVVSSTPTKHKA